MLAATRPDGQALLVLFPRPRDGNPAIYIVDPLDDLMMGYPAAASGGDLLQGFERLLCLSRIG